MRDPIRCLDARAITAGFAFGLVLGMALAWHLKPGHRISH
jgi:hypothetical protein